MLNKCHLQRCNNLLTDICYEQDLFWREFEATGKNSWHGDILIQFLPAQRKTIHLDFNLFQLLICGRSQASKTVGRKPDKAPVMQFDIYCSSFGPSTHSGRLQGNRWFSEDGVHNMLCSVLVDFRKRGVRSVAGHAILLPGCLREKWKAPARICSLRQASGHGYGEAHFPRRCRSENGTLRCAELSHL